MNRVYGDNSSSHHSITSLIRLVKDEDPDAAAEIWNRYLVRLMRLAQNKMQGAPRLAADEEDVMVSVFNKFFEQAAKGSFKQLDDREDLWYILVMLTENKIIDQYRRQTAEKRGGGKLIAEIDLDVAGDSERARNVLHQLVENERSPEYAIAFGELVTKALDRLDEPIARRVAELTLSGYGKKEIATELDVSVRTVDRKMLVIREIWREVFGDWV